MPEPKEAAQCLLESLPALEESVKALKSKSWEDTTEALETLDRAKMNVLLAYAVNDLIWGESWRCLRSDLSSSWTVYLKTIGVDPSTHEVSAELERIKRYYGKIQAVENPTRECLFLPLDVSCVTVLCGLFQAHLSPASVELTAERTRSVDKAAAHRFITASIPLAQRSQPPTSGTAPTTSAQAQASADARVALGLDSDNAQNGPEVELGASGDTSKAGRFRFIPRQAEKTRARAEDAWNDVNELKDDTPDSEQGAQAVASGSKTHFDDDGEAMPPGVEDVEGLGQQDGHLVAEQDEPMTEAESHDAQVDENKDRSTSPADATTKGTLSVKEKKKQAKMSADVARAAQAAPSGKKDKKKKKQKKTKAKA